jgi:hypothetical protein
MRRFASMSQSHMRPRNDAPATDGLIRALAGKEAPIDEVTRLYELEWAALEASARLKGYVGAQMALPIDQTVLAPSPQSPKPREPNTALAVASGQGFAKVRLQSPKDDQRQCSSWSAQSCQVFSW